MDYLSALSALAQQYQSNPAMKFVVDETFEVIGRSFIHRFTDRPQRKQQEAFINVVDFAERLRRSLERLIDEGQATAQAIERAISSVSVDSFIEDATIRAAETDNRLAHEYLARLVSRRLVVLDDSLLAIKLRLGLDLLRSLTSRQLKALGLLYLFQLYPGEWEGVTRVADLDVAEQEFTEWVNKLELPFEGFRPTYADLVHLQGLSLVKISENATGGILLHDPGEFTMMGMATQLLGLERSLNIPALNRLSHLWSSDFRVTTHVGLKWIEPQPLALLLGAFVLDSLTGVVSDYSQFEEALG